VSRLITRLTPVVTKVLTANAEQVAARDLRSTVRVDGFVAPTGDRRKGTYTSGMYSGKRHRCVKGAISGTKVLVSHTACLATASRTIGRAGLKQQSACLVRVARSAGRRCAVGRRRSRRRRIRAGD
jgi:hypothetical protein